MLSHFYTHARTNKLAHTDQCVILTAFPQQQWFCERASTLRYTHIACLVLCGMSWVAALLFDAV